MSKAIQKILRFVPELIRDPFLILNRDGEILFANQSGVSFLKIEVIGGNLSDVFVPESLKILNDMLTKLFGNPQQEIVGQVQLGLVYGERINTEVRLRSFEYENSLFVFCTIIPGGYKISSTGKSEISSYSDEIDIIKKDEVIEIVNKVKTLFPITFIGRELIHNLVDNLDEIFFVANLEGDLLLTNDFFTKSFGMKDNVAEGKNILDFIPGYLANMNSVIFNFIKNTNNCVAIRGVYFQELESIKQKELVLIPLLDSKTKTCAIVGYSQTLERIDLDQESILKSKHSEQFLNNFPKPVAFITNSGSFLNCSDDFCKILKHRREDLHGLKFADILPISLAESIQRFILSPDDLRILPVNKNFEIARSDEPEYTIYLSKLLTGENQPESISIFIEKIEYAENLQHLIKSRGRMFESLIENNPEPIFIYDKENLQFLEANRTALELYGYSREEFLQMDLTDLYNPEDIQTLLGSSNENDNGGKYSTPYRHKKKDGSSVYVEVSKFTFTFNNRDVYCNIIKDVSEKLELTKSNQIFKAAFNKSSDLIFVTDPDGIITFVNSAAAFSLGMEKSDLINSSMASLVEDEDRLTINTTIFQSYLAEPIELNIKLKCKDGKVLESEISATPIVDFEGSIESFVIIGKTIQSVDIKSEKTKSGKITEEKITVETSDTAQLQTAFLSGVFHEILTPMNVILGFAQELTEGIENLSPDQKEAVEIINQNRGKLLSTMNAIIEYSEIQKNKDEWETSKLTITKVVEEIDRDIFEITGSKEINFAYGKISSSLQFETDKKKFDCLVNNYLRLVSRLISEDKVYFSAYQVEENKFLIMISDSFASVSESLSDTLKKLFVDKKDPKELGIPKLGVQIVQSLSELMNVKFVHSIDDLGKIEAGFLFPITFSPEGEASDQENLEEIKTDQEQIQESEKVEETGYDFASEQVENEFNGEPEETEDILATEFQTPDIVQTPENKFDAIDFVSSVDDSPVESEDDNLTTESTSVTGDIHKPLSFEEKPEQEEFETGTEFKPLTPQAEDEKLIVNIPVEEESSFDSAEGTETFDNADVPAHQDVTPDDESGIVETQPPHLQDKSDEDVNLINRQAFTFEEASDSKFASSDDKLELNGLTCLYIEDQVDSQILFKVQMKGLKDIKYAVSFEDALPLLKTEKFDFIVMDINLQGEYNGLDALKLIHKMQGYGGIPIVAVTAYVLPGDKEKFIATGFNDFISKPIFREKMVESLEKIFLQKA